MAPPIKSGGQVLESGIIAKMGAGNNQENKAQSMAASFSRQRPQHHLRPHQALCKTRSPCPSMTHTLSSMMGTKIMHEPRQCAVCNQPTGPVTCKTKTRSALPSLCRIKQNFAACVCCLETRSLTYARHGKTGHQHNGQQANSSSDPQAWCSSIATISVKCLMHDWLL